MKHNKITAYTISDLTGTTAPSAGANGELGLLALKSEVEDVKSSIKTIQTGTIAVSASTIIVPHSTVVVNNTTPFISLTMPSDASILYIHGVTNRTSNSFEVVFSSTPEVSAGYYLNWVLL